MMKKVLLSVLAVLLVCSQAHAFFNPVDLIMDVAAQEAERSIRETPSPAFLGIIQVYNMTCDRPVTENMVKDYWKAFGKTLEDPDDALTLFAKVAQSRKADLEPVKVDYLKNLERFSRNVAFCTGEELREAVEGGAILYVHFDETLTQNKEMADAVYSMALPFLGHNFRLGRPLEKQSDNALVVAKTRNGKAVIDTAEGEKELDFDSLIEVSDYVLAFDSPKWRESVQAVREEKDELDSYMDQLRQEVKEDKEDKKGEDA